jgi:hypothetical protein
LVFNFTYNHIPKILTSNEITHLKERTLDEFDLIVGTAQNETSDIFGKTFKELSDTKKLGSSLGLVVLWDTFVKSPEFLKYTPTERTKIVKNMHTILPQEVLLGDDGYVFLKMEKKLLYF